MPKIDGARLKYLREKRRLTQEGLAAESHIDKGTISRRERLGKVGTATRHTVEQLCKVLQIDPELLSGEAPLPDDAARHADRPKGEVRFKMDDQNRNALALVCSRYRVPPDLVLGVAPLLFFIAAETSLNERRSACSEAWTAWEAVRKSVGRLPASPSTYDDMSENAINAESASIERRDLFGRPHPDDDVSGVHYDQDYDEGSDNPFATFLRTALAGVVPQDRANDLPAAEFGHWYSDSAPSYHVCRDQALDVVNGNAIAARAILNGVAALHEMRKELSGQVTSEQREAWAMERVQMAERDLLELMGDLPDMQS